MARSTPTNTQASAIQVQRDAQLWWAEQHRAIESGTWKQQPTSARQQKRSFGEVCDAYRKWAEVNLRSYENYVAIGLKFWEGQFRREISPEKITPQWIETVKSAYAQNVEWATVDRKLEALRAMFNWAIQKGVVGGPNPMTGVKLFKPNNEIVRYLTADEYAAVLDAANRERWYVRPVIEAAANIGLRKQNIRLRWEECDFGTGVTRLTKTKSKKTVTIPMTEAARAVDRVQKKTGRYAYVFCHFEGGAAWSAYRGYKEILEDGVDGRRDQEAFSLSRPMPLLRLSIGYERCKLNGCERNPRRRNKIGGTEHYRYEFWVGSWVGEFGGLPRRCQ